MVKIVELKDTKRDYAKHCIENYKTASKYVNHGFTFLTTILQSLFSVIFPDGKNSNEIFESLTCDDTLPYFNNSGFEDTNDYLYDIRNALSHKTKRNFSTLAEADKIKLIQLNSSKDRIFKFNFKQLEDILYWLEKRVNPTMNDI